MTDSTTTTAGDHHDRRVGRRDVTEWRTKAGQRLASSHHSLARKIGARRALLSTLAVGGGIAVLASFVASRIFVGWVTGAGWLSLIVTSHRLFLSSQEDAKHNSAG